MTVTEEPAAFGTDRVVAALARGRVLLGPDVVPDAVLGDVDESRLAESGDVAPLELGDLVLSYTGPDALEVTRAAYELAELARGLQQRTIDRRMTGLSAVQRALAELRAVG